MKNLHFKAMNGQMTVDEAQGIVECFVAAVGNKDSVGDIIIPGAFEKSFKKRKPRVVWGHDWNQPIGKVLDIYEVGPRDPRLPGKMKQAGVGGVFAKVQFNLNSERGREAFSNILFFGEEQEWSIGYKTIDAVWDPGTQANVLKELELYEVSPVLHGANQLTATISIKDAKGADADEDEITSLRDSKWDTFDIAWAKKLKDEHPDIWGKGGNIKGNDQWRILTQIAEKGKATTQAELNALKLREAWIARHKGDFRLPGVVAQIKWLAVGTRGEAYMKNLVREAVDRKEEKGYWDDDLLGKSGSVMGVRAGGFVRWDSSGGTAYGKILRVAKGGTISAKPTGPSMRGTEDNPAVEVQVWKFRNGSWDETDVVTVHRSDALQPVDSLPKSKAAPSVADLDALTDAVGLDPLPQERITGDVMRGYGPRRGNLEKLLRYWRPIMRKPGGFRRCRVILADHPELYPLENLCAWLHHETTGLWPNEGCHHPGMKNCRRKMRGVVNGSVLSDAEFNSRLRKLGKKDANGSIEDYAPAEQQFIRSLLDIVAEHGRLSDGDDNGIYVGYTPASENDVADMGIKCANCAFYAGGTSCRIVEAEVEPGGKCRLAAIDYDSVKGEYEDDEDEDELFEKFASALRDFVRDEPEFIEYLEDDDNWTHEGQEHDEDDWHEHMPLVPMGKKPCGCDHGEKGKNVEDVSFKAGRILSGRNHTRLKDAMNLIKAVIDESGLEAKDDAVDAVTIKSDRVHDLVADIAPVLHHHGLDVKVVGGVVSLPPSVSDEALEAIANAMDNLGYDTKGLLARIGGMFRGGRGGGGRGRGKTPKPAAFDPNAPDADGDGIAQEGTTAAHAVAPDGLDEAIGKFDEAMKSMRKEISDAFEAGDNETAQKKLNELKKLFAATDAFEPKKDDPGYTSAAYKEWIEARSEGYSFLKKWQTRLTPGENQKPKKEAADRQYAELQGKFADLVAEAADKPLEAMDPDDRSYVGNYEVGMVVKEGDDIGVIVDVNIGNRDKYDELREDEWDGIIVRWTTKDGQSLAFEDQKTQVYDAESNEGPFDEEDEEWQVPAQPQLAKEVNRLYSLENERNVLERAMADEVRAAEYRRNRPTRRAENIEKAQAAKEKGDADLADALDVDEVSATQLENAIKRNYVVVSSEGKEGPKAQQLPSYEKVVTQAAASAVKGSRTKPYEPELEGIEPASKWLQADLQRSVNYGPEAGFPDGRPTPTNFINNTGEMEKRELEYEQNLKRLREIADVAGIELEDMTLDEAGEFLAGLADSKHPPSKILSAVVAFEQGKLDEVSKRIGTPERRASMALSQAKSNKNPRPIYALRGKIPDAMYENLLEQYNSFAKAKGKSLTVDSDTHKSLLPVVKHHGIPYGLVGKSVVYDTATIGDEALDALLTARVAVKREYGPTKREEYAEAGLALPDGSYPIRDLGDLRNAIKAYGRAKDKPLAKRHIIKRARALKAVAELPEGWV